jgi:hypothetical protein
MRGYGGQHIQALEKYACLPRDGRKNEVETLQQSYSVWPFILAERGDSSVSFTFLNDEIPTPASSRF